MPRKIWKFLDDLATDAGLQESFEKAPFTTMLEEGLEAEDAALVLEGDLGKLKKKIEDEQPPTGAVLLIKRH